MDLRLLRYFMALADELHFGRAAERLHICQPPLSQQIRLLEEELGTPLFERSHHRVELTAAGQMLKEQAPLVFEQLERALDLTRQTGRGQLGELEIGMISSVMVGVLPKALHLFRERYPQVTWRLHEMTPADLALEPFVALELKQSRFANFLYQCCIQAGFTPQIRQQVIEVQTLLSLVRAGFGVALLPASIEQLAPAGLVFRNLTPALPEVPLYVTYRADDASPVLKLFLDTLRELRENP